MNFALFLELKARSEPDSLALADHRLRLSWRELDACASQLAHLLVLRGLGPADRMAVYLPNRVEAVIALLGCMKAGVVAVPLNWRLSGDELHRVLAHCDAAVLLTTDDRATALARQTGSCEVLEVATSAMQGSFWRAIGNHGTNFRAVGCQASDVASLLYTSGTTSAPKAAIHTHGMRVAIAAAMADSFALTSRDVALAVSPLFHTSGLSVFSNALFAGCPLILLEKWDLDHFVRVVADEGITFMHLIGTLLVDIAKAPEQAFAPLRSNSRMRFTWGGGHSIHPDSFLAYEERIGGTFLLGYSRTEGGLTYNPLDREARRFDHHGLPNRNSSDLAVIDAATRLRCPQGEVGEICFRGDGVSPGYWEGSFVRVVPPYEGGWQPTGDLGFIDAQGCLHFLGRSDNMMKSGGENVFPDEVVKVLLAMPQVADAVVLGLPDERMGERVAAVIVRGDETLRSSEIETACRAALAAYKIPRVLAFTNALPRLGSGKVDLAACRDLLLAEGSAGRPGVQG